MRKLHNVQCDNLVTATRFIPNSSFFLLDFRAASLSTTSTTWVTVRRYPSSGGFSAGTWLVSLHSSDSHSGDITHGQVRLLKQPGATVVHQYRVNQRVAGQYMANAMMTRIVTLNANDYFELQLTTSSSSYSMTIIQVLFYAIRVG